MVRHTEKSGSKPRPGQAEKKPKKSERIAKALARAGIASRREVERLIGLGKVAVNGRILDTPAVLVTRDDIVTVDGKLVDAPESTRLWRYHKPVGLVTSHMDPEDRPTVFQHLPNGLPRVISIGRLDINSEGLLLLTNDGEMSRALELPTNGWPRVYRARALGRTTQAALDELQNGITVDGVHYGAIEAKLDKLQEKDDGRANIWITLTLSEGKNREVRRVLEALGLKVNRLIRLGYGPFNLGALEQGAVEEVGPRVIRELLSEFIAPENMPTGDKVATPLTSPSRRPAASSRPRPDNAIADPNKKPSRVRAQADRDSAPERPARSYRTEAPRGTGPRGGAAKGGYQGDRPRGPVSGDDKPRGGYGRPREGGEGDARPERFERKPGWAKPGGGATAASAPRPRSAAPRPAPTAEGDQPIKRADRSFSRNKAQRTTEGPTRADRPYNRERGEGARPEGFKSEGYKGKTFKPRAEGGRSESSPRADGRPGGYAGRREDAERGERRGPARSGAGGKPGGFKPRSDGPPSGEDRRGPRPGGKPGFKPRSDGPRSDGPRPDGPRSYGARSDAPRGDGPPRGPRPGGARPGGKPAGKPGGKPGGSRGPRS